MTNLVFTGGSLNSGKPDPGSVHFSDAQWADFTRNAGGVEGRGEMQAHLDAGCEQCSALVARMQAVVRMAINERMLVIPEDVVRRAKEIADVAPPSSGWIESLTAIAARLIESSSLDWQPSGVRSLAEPTESAGGRMLFRADDYAVYLRVEPLLGGEAAEIIGEIVNEHQQEENLDGIPVQMVARGQTLSETATNRFGEFVIEYPIRKNATLRFALRHRGQRIDLPIEPRSAGGRN